MENQILLKRGTLWDSLVSASGRALKKGAQIPIPTKYEFIEDAGVSFLVRVIAALKKKEEEKRKPQGEKKNPFLPYEEDLFVADISDTHVALLNKFNVVENHLLIVTRQFEDQNLPLTQKDFEALWICMQEYNALGFYNGGEAAGASQPHRHLQLIPLPLCSEKEGVPIESLFPGSGLPGELLTIPTLPFRHSFARTDNSAAASLPKAKEYFSLYLSMLSHFTKEKIELEKPTAPYCFMMTKKWMMLVPRSKEFFDSVSINSLGFAGALLVRDREQLNLLKAIGPMNALKSVAFPVS